MNIKTLLTLSLLMASFNAQSAVTACPLGWTKSADGLTCVLETKTTQTPNQVSNTAKPVCISGFTYSSNTAKCEKNTDAYQSITNKSYAYIGTLKLGPNPQEEDKCLNFTGTQTVQPVNSYQSGGGNCACNSGTIYNGKSGDQAKCDLIVVSISGDGSQSANYNPNSKMLDINAVGSTINWGQTLTSNTNIYISDKNAVKEFILQRFASDNFMVLYVNGFAVKSFPEVAGANQVTPVNVNSINLGSKFYYNTGQIYLNYNFKYGIVGSYYDYDYGGEYLVVDGYSLDQANYWYQSTLYYVGNNTYVTPETGYCYSGTVNGDFKFRDGSGTDYISSCTRKDNLLPIDLKPYLKNGNNEIKMIVGNGVGPWAAYSGIKFSY